MNPNRHCSRVASDRERGPHSEAAQSTSLSQRLTVAVYDGPREGMVMCNVTMHICVGVSRAGGKEFFLKEFSRNGFYG